MEENNRGVLKTSTKIRKNKTFTIVCIVCLCVILLIIASITIIPTGYTGVKMTFGKVSEKPLPEGMTVKAPIIQRIEKVNNRQQTVTIPIGEDESGAIEAETKDGTKVTYGDITVTYSISPEHSVWVYSNVSNYEEDLITKQMVASEVMKAAKALSDNEALNRESIEPEVEKRLQVALDEQYEYDSVLIDNVSVGKASFDKTYEEAIAKRQEAKVQAEQKEIENKQYIEQIKAEAEAEKAKAQIEAETMKIRAQAEVEANNILKENMNDMLLQYKAIDKWDGQGDLHIDSTAEENTEKKK